MRVARVHNHGKATKKDHKEKDQASGNVDVGENVVDEIANAIVL